MSKGYVYILTNPCFNAYFKSKIVKIGQAKDVKKRVATLNTSVPVRFDVFATLYTSKYKIVEKKIHQKLKGYSAIQELHGERRVTAENGEFYLITPKKALRALIDESELIDDSDKSWELYGHGKRKAKTVPTSISGKASWNNVTQLAKLIARRGGNEGAFGGILHYFSRKRPCVKTSKWRKPLEDIGVKFDAQDFVTDWQCAKKEF